MDVGRSWSVRDELQRGAVSVLQGVSLTSFATDSANVVGQRPDQLTHRDVDVGDLLERAGGRVRTRRAGSRTTRGSLQFRYAISRCCATAVNYDYYVYNFEDVADLSPAFRPRISIGRPSGWASRSGCRSTAATRTAAPARSR